MTELTPNRQAWQAGFICASTWFATWKDGQELVGCGNTPLSAVISRVKKGQYDHLARAYGHHDLDARIPPEPDPDSESEDPQYYVSIEGAQYCVPPNVLSHIQDLRVRLENKETKVAKLSYALRQLREEVAKAARTLIESESNAEDARIALRKKIQEDEADREHLRTYLSKVSSYLAEARLNRFILGDT